MKITTLNAMPICENKKKTCLLLVDQKFVLIKTNHQRHVFVNLNSKRIAQTNLNILSSFLWRYLLTIFKPALCKKKSLSSMHVKWNKLF